MRRILGLVLVIVLLASAVPLAVTPAAATYPYEKKIPGDADENGELTKGELSSAILPYMLDEGDFKLDDVGDAAYVYAYWGGKPKTVVDGVKREVMFYRPIERVVSTFPSLTRLIVALEGIDKLVGASQYMTTQFKPGPYGDKMLVLWAYPELKELLGVGSYSKPNLEQILSLKPDVVFIDVRLSPTEANTMQTSTGVHIVGLPVGHSYEGEGGSFDGYRIAGEVIGKEERAEELISFINEEFDKVRAVTSEIPDDERVSAYMCFSTVTRVFESTPGVIAKAGGINVAEGVSEQSVSKEQIIKWNPDIIMVHCIKCATVKGIILNDPLLQSVNAVNNGTVYCTRGGWFGMDPATGVTEVPYMAKLFYPDKFKDLDVEKDGNRILEEIYGVDGMYTRLQEVCDLYKWE